MLLRDMMNIVHRTLVLEQIKIGGGSRDAAVNSLASNADFHARAGTNRHPDVLALPRVQTTLCTFECGPHCYVAAPAVVQRFPIKSDCNSRFADDSHLLAQFDLLDFHFVFSRICACGCKFRT